MFSQFIRDTNTNDTDIVTHKVTGRWWLSDEQKKFMLARYTKRPEDSGRFS
jgi:hypothetical protein